MDGVIIYQNLLARAALLAAGLLAAAGCAASSPGRPPAASAAPGSTRAPADSARPAGTTRPAAPAATRTAPAATAPAASATTSPAAPGSAPGSGATAATTYLAESQDIRGTIVRAPACPHGCPLSGDGTIILYDMTWTAWNGTQAVGRGTEAIESCVPTCAAGGQYKVAVTVTLRDPEPDCTPQGSTLWVWTSASFTWPDGLPKALRGQGAPDNPWTFTALRGELATSCP
jgi:hypothetical protein